jgi:hypothetical protein
MDTGDGDEICGRCLINWNGTRIVASWGGHGQEPDTEMAEPASMTPAALKKWAQDMLYGNRARISADAVSQRFEAISTWHGDPVCGYHLRVLAEAEMRRGYT